MKTKKAIFSAVLILYGLMVVITCIPAIASLTVVYPKRYVCIKNATANPIYYRYYWCKDGDRRCTKTVETMIRPGYTDTLWWEGGVKVVVMFETGGPGGRDRKIRLWATEQKCTPRSTGVFRVKGNFLSLQEP